MPNTRHNLIAESFVHLLLKSFALETIDAVWPEFEDEVISPGTVEKLWQRCCEVEQTREV